jgi:hypothetical protein
MTYETIGMIGSIVILISMCFKASTYKGNLLMRSFNFIGSLIYIYYGLHISAYSVVFLNCILSVVNLYYFIYAIRNKE